MAKEISRRHRPEHKDFEVIVEDDHGIRRPIYPAYGREDCPCCGRAFAVDEAGQRSVNGDVEGHIKLLEAAADAHAEILKAAGEQEYVAQMTARRAEHNLGQAATASVTDGTDCGCVKK